MCLFGCKRNRPSGSIGSESSLESLDAHKTDAGGFVKTKSENPLKGTKREPRFLIIGAGAAGLACATRLVEAGHKNVTIIEAENRIGGRIHTHKFADNVVDLGAQWCHGEVDNVVYEMVGGHNMVETTGDIYVTFQCIRSNGEVLRDEVVERLKNLISEIFTNRHEDIGTFHGSFSEFLMSKFVLALSKPEYSDIDRTVAFEFFENFKKIEGSETGASMEQVSASGFDEYWQCDGDYLLNFKNKGFISFLRLLMQSDKGDSEFGILDGKIVFGKTVQKVIWNRPDTVVKVKVKGQEKFYEAEHVIVTVPLGVLKKNYKEMFFPTLPRVKQIAIEGLGYGNVFKIFLEFPTTFWPKNWTGFSILWLEEDCEELNKTNRGWLTAVNGFYTVNYQPRVLVAWIVGNYVMTFEQMEKKDLQMYCVYLLKRFLPKWRIPEPTNMACSSWSTNPNFCGAYSFRSIETDKFDTNSTSLAQPLTVLTYVPTLADDPTGSGMSLLPMTIKPVVLFAGEATSSHYYSTVHGAVESGWREASRLDGYYSA